MKDSNRELTKTQKLSMLVVMRKLARDKEHTHFICTMYEQFFGYATPRMHVVFPELYNTIIEHIKSTNDIYKKCGGWYGMAIESTSDKAQAYLKHNKVKDSKICYNNRYRIKVLMDLTKSLKG